MSARRKAGEAEEQQAGGQEAWAGRASESRTDSCNNPVRPTYSRGPAGSSLQPRCHLTDSEHQANLKLQLRTSGILTATEKKNQLKLSIPVKITTRLTPPLPCPRSHEFKTNWTEGFISASIWSVLFSRHKVNEGHMHRTMHHKQMCLFWIFLHLFGWFWWWVYWKHWLILLTWWFLTQIGPYTHHIQEKRFSWNVWRQSHGSLWAWVLLSPLMWTELQIFVKWAGRNSFLWMFIFIFASSGQWMSLFWMTVEPFCHSHHSSLIV